MEAKSSHNERNGSGPFKTTPMVRWYVDTRNLTSKTSLLPLVETLQPQDQDAVEKYLHLKDRHMSLASYLLKYLFIHRSCRIPWDEIWLSRTPAPHGRPCFIPPPISSSSKDNDDDSARLNVEFNVSHQASLVALAGTVFYCYDSKPALLDPTPAVEGETEIGTRLPPQVGIDITCVDEQTNRGRRHANLTTTSALAQYVDIFAEVFSPRELITIKSLASARNEYQLQQPKTEAERVRSALRLFYTYWALKEAYIKMTGEALLAPWLRELEFTDVQAPEEPGSNNGNRDPSGSPLVSDPYTGTQTWLYGKKVQGLRIEVVAYEDDYLVATAARGAGIGGGNDVDLWKDLKEIDLERDIEPCATGQCDCLA